MIRPSINASALLAGLLVPAVIVHAISAAPPLAADKGHSASSALGYESPFKTGYEPNEATGTPADAHTWMVFQNTSTVPPSAPFALGISYETPGDVTDRYARIIDDPTHADNKVLHYWLKNAVIETGFQNHLKGRIQTDFPVPLENVTEVYASQRLFVHDDVNHLLNYPADGDPWWIEIIIQTLWSGANWLGHPNPARVTLSMYPYGGSMRLELRCTTQLNFEVFWYALNPEFALPVGQWVTVEIAYKMGDATSGRMVVVVTEELTGHREVVFNVTNWTYNPSADDPGGTGPVSLTHWNPQKLYSSDNVLHFIRDSGGVAQLYWDDFEFSPEWPPGFPSDSVSVPAASTWGLTIFALLVLTAGTICYRRAPATV